MPEKRTVSPLPSPFPLGFENAFLWPTKHLAFDQLENPGRKTSVWNVISQSSDAILGQIKWYGAWRQYCFFPESGTIFNPECLVGIVDRIETCNRWQNNIRTNLAIAAAKAGS